MTRPEDMRLRHWRGQGRVRSTGHPASHAEPRTMGRDAPDGRALLHWREDLPAFGVGPPPVTIPCGTTIGGNRSGDLVAKGCRQTARRPSHYVARPLDGESHHAINTLMAQPASRQDNKNIPAGSSRRLTRECVLASPNTTFFFQR